MLTLIMGPVTAACSMAPVGVVCQAWLVPLSAISAKDLQGGGREQWVSGSPTPCRCAAAAFEVSSSFP